ncbi:hypothetical protein [Paenibacillus medicaginis]|uniref:Uncharacterized protein n=1 Tax=Paenibacillus medicaginis TaxID=1470560 RepID=A0ABV5BUU9_9BACL
MKKCPKCFGKGIIKNYIMIDGGKCYECNGKQWVDDNHVMSKPFREYKPPKWLVEKEERIMSDTARIRNTVAKRIKSTLQISAIECEDVRELIDDYHDRDLFNMSDQEFHNVTMNAYIDLKELMRA